MPHPDGPRGYKLPYIVMGKALGSVDRDIVYSLCQYGMGNVWEWGAEVGGNYWRTTGDLTDVWSNMSAVGFRQAGREKWSRPGHWTDPDMLVVGKVGWGASVHDTRLTPNEQITHITLWSIQAAPLLLGADMAAFDRFTTDLMTNHEVLEVNQDRLGRGGSRVWQRWASANAASATNVHLNVEFICSSPAAGRPVADCTSSYNGSMLRRLVEAGGMKSTAVSVFYRIAIRWLR